MNEFEDKLVQTVMASLQGFEVKMTENIGEIRGDLKTLTEAVRASVTNDTKRLDKHSEELDDQRDRLIALEGWRENQEKNQENHQKAESKKTMNRIAISNTIAVVIAVVLAYAFQKLG